MSSDGWKLGWLMQRVRRRSTLAGHSKRGAPTVDVQVFRADSAFIYATTVRDW